MNGETVMHCGHLDGYPMHWWKFEHEVYFRRPDKTVGTTIWLVACDCCHNNCGGDASKIQVRGDAVWNGDEPAITEN